MEQETFNGIRDLLHELGAIDANGLNYRRRGGGGDQEGGLKVGAGVGG